MLLCLFSFESLTDSCSCWSWRLKVQTLESLSMLRAMNSHEADGFEWESSWEEDENFFQTDRMPLISVSWLSSIPGEFVNNLSFDRYIYSGQALQRSIFQKFKNGIRSIALHNNEKTAPLSDCSSHFPRGLISHFFLVLLMNNLNSGIDWGMLRSLYSNRLLCSAFGWTFSCLFIC